MHLERAEASRSVQAYLADIRHLPRLTREEEIHLARSGRDGEPEAINRLVEGNLRFVTKVALEYRTFGLPLEDLVNEGNMGLIEAAKHFDPERGIKFITYAVWWVRRAILRALSNQIRLVRLPAWQTRKARELRETQQRLQNELGRRPTREELSRSLDTSETKVDETLLQLGREVSLDQPAGRFDEGTPLCDTLEDLEGLSFESELVRRQLTAEMNKILACLTAQQQRILRMRFGLDGKPPLTLRAVGAEVGLTRERVRQIELEAKTTMRELFAELHSI